ncbi:MAG: SGNH/GDSL hydrolase family protein [Ruminococcus sp.]|uniref:SGNH/GDSL hydrolase family protein n=1 Tax=Ruminococcus sp. TaxID=41978 RepID=UPI0025F9DCD7|nr:SGNH/GDSL hydrolase family protein [Ruminococcus sp.]MBO4867401.1 SGNH/GDSL hydrolase family protein [Ruminococcus sp.]
MKKRITAFVTACAAAFGMCSCTLKERDMVEETKKLPVPPKLVFLGDSIAAGYGLDGYDKSDLYHCDSYANIIGSDYAAVLANEDCGFIMKNDAVSGNTSQDLIDLLDSGNIDEDLKDSDAVVVSIGGNDILHIIFSAAEDLGWDKEAGDFDFDRINFKDALSSLTSMSDEIDDALKGYETNLALIEQKLRDRTDGEIYIQTLYNPVEYFSDWKMLVDYADGKIDTFNDIVKDSAEKDGKHHYTVIDVGSRFEGQNADLTNMADYDIHPNAEGHKVIAEMVDAELRKGDYSCTVTVPGEAHWTSAAKGLFVGIAAVAVILVIGVVIFVMKKKQR